ncbi:allantoate permease [Purpureocillium lavendulum]|uniref:Allantoate permease n=1 Tax=Purpureocillium lavendulum TaxID=1247861 RepID=A0AB34G3R2_9HYPO|nr:allantoate permease [Purpureocillium lavendulum]
MQVRRISTVTAAVGPLIAMAKDFSPAEKDLNPAPTGEISPVESRTIDDLSDGVDRETAQYAAREAVVIDEATNKRLFWAINKHVLPFMLGTYFCQTLDKGTMGFASIMGIIQDAGHEGNKFNWVGTVLYMGALLGEYPTNFLIQKLPVGKYLAFNVGCWGAVVACSAAAQNFPALMAVRFLLGLFESVVQPAFIVMYASLLVPTPMIQSHCYTKQEQMILVSLWYSMMGIQLMLTNDVSFAPKIGGMIAYGVSHYSGEIMKSWQLLFMVLGLATVVWACCLARWLPDSPMQAKCFNEDEKRLMVERVRANETGIQNRTYKKPQIREAVTDPVVWCYILLQLTSTLIIGGLSTFSNLIIKSFGFTYLQTQLLNIAQGAVTIGVMVGGAWTATATRQTAFVMHAWSIPAIIGTSVIYSIAPSKDTRIGLLIAFYCTQFFLAQGNLIFSFISRNIAGQTKKSTTLALTFIGWAVGNMTAPQIFQSTDAPRYRKGFTAHFCLYVVFNGILATLRVLLVRRNRAKRAAHVGGGGSDGDNDGRPLADGEGKGGREHISHSNAFADLTDIQNPDFRYDV